VERVSYNIWKHILEKNKEKNKEKNEKNVYSGYLTHHEEKPLPSLPAKCPDVTTHGVQSYIMWKINLWQTMLMHAWLSPQVSFNIL
jgi:hypothetical protein